MKWSTLLLLLMVFSLLVSDQSPTSPKTEVKFASLQALPALGFDALPFFSHWLDEAEVETPVFPATTLYAWDGVLEANVENRAATLVSDNAFNHVAGNCTWYVYGRIAELKEAGLLDKARAELILHELRTGARPRHAKHWDTIISGNWISTASYASLPSRHRKKGAIILWDYGRYGHVGFVEEVSTDLKSFRVSHFNWWNCANAGDSKAECGYQKIGRYFTDWMHYDDESSVQLRVFPKFLVIK